MILRDSQKLESDLKFWRASCKLLSAEEKAVANKLIQNVMDTVDKIDMIHTPGANGVTPPSMAKDLREELVKARLDIKNYLDGKLKARKRLKLR